MEGGRWDAACADVRRVRAEVDNALMLLLFAVTFAMIVGILLVVGHQIDSIVSTVSDGVDQ